MITSSRKKNKEKSQYKIDAKWVDIPFTVEVSKKGKRVKVNFMVDIGLLEALNHYVPNGGKSDFINGILEQALVRYKREKAFQAMDELREKTKIRMSTEEFIRLKNYGRE